MDKEGARVGLPLTTVEVCDPEGSFPGLNKGVRGEPVISRRIKPNNVRQGRRVCSVLLALIRGGIVVAGSHGVLGFFVHRWVSKSPV